MGGGIILGIKINIVPTRGREKKNKKKKTATTNIKRKKMNKECEPSQDIKNPKTKKGTTTTREQATNTKLWNRIVEHIYVCPTV